MDEIMREGKETLTMLKDRKIKQEVRDIRELDPLDSLRRTIGNFFEGMLQTIRENDYFKTQIQNNLFKKMEENEIDVTQLIGLYKSIEKEKANLLVNLFNILFKPNPDGNSSPLFNFNIGSLSENSHRKLSASDYEAADKIERVFQHIKQRSAERTDEDS